MGSFLITPLVYIIFAIIFYFKGKEGGKMAFPVLCFLCRRMRGIEHAPSPFTNGGIIASAVLRPNCATATMMPETYFVTKSNTVH